MNRKMLSGFWDAPPIFNPWVRDMLWVWTGFFRYFPGITGLLCPRVILFVLCWVCACGSRKGQLRRCWQRYVTLEVQLLSGAPFSQCAASWKTLCWEQYPCLNNEQKKNNMFGLDWTTPGWQHGTTSHSHSLTQSALVVGPQDHVCGWPACHICLTVARMQIETHLLGFLAWFHSAQQRTLYQYTWIPGLQAQVPFTSSTKSHSSGLGVHNLAWPHLRVKSKGRGLQRVPGSERKHRVSSWAHFLSPAHIHSGKGLEQSLWCTRPRALGPRTVLHPQMGWYYA